MTVSEQTFYILLSVLTGFVFAWDIVSVAAIYRTKRTPRTARFLTCALISFECVGLLSLDMDKYISNMDISPLFRLHIIVLGLLIYTTILLMAFERLSFLNATNVFHNNDFRHKLITRLAICLWMVEVIAIFTFRMLVCGNSISCANATQKTVRVTNFVILLIADGLGVLTFYHLRTNAHVLHGPIFSARATTILFLYIAIYTLFSAVLAIGFLLSLAAHLPQMYHVIGLIACVIEPIIYVYWYKESRMELMKLFSVCFPKLTTVTERMRIDIFNIPTYPQH